MSQLINYFFRLLQKMSEIRNGVKCGETVSVLKPDKRLKTRLEALAEHFKSKFDCEPTFFVRVPGRYVCFCFIKKRKFFLKKPILRHDTKLYKTLLKKYKQTQRDI